MSTAVPRGGEATSDEKRQDPFSWQWQNNSKWEGEQYQTSDTIVLDDVRC